MKIVVQGNVIETRDITAIYDVEKHVTQFRNRKAGFIVQFTDDSLSFYEEIPYETGAGRIADIKSKWRSRMEEVIKLWEQDKHDYPTVDW